MKTKHLTEQDKIKIAVGVGRTLCIHCVHYRNFYLNNDCKASPRDTKYDPLTGVLVYKHSDSRWRSYGSKYHDITEINDGHCPKFFLKPPWWKRLFVKVPKYKSKFVEE